MRTTFVRLMLILALLPVLAACANDAATVDTDAIAATVQTRLEAEQADVEQTSAGQAVDTEAVVATVQAQLQAEEVATEQAEPEPTIAPTATAQATILPTGNVSSQLRAADDLQTALVDVYQQANPAVVYIVVPPLGSGTGFVYGDEGYIVTNNHVVEGGRSYEVVFANGERRQAELVGADVDSDLAVIQVDDLPADVTPLSLADGNALQVGQFVVAIGNPFGEEGSMSLGIISAMGRSLPSQRDLGTGSTYSLPEVIQTDTPINPGNSGGPLLNLAGEVVGINSAIVSLTGINSGVGYAIPVQAVQQIVPTLIAEGAYEYSYMGAGFEEEVSLSEQTTYGLSQTQGAYVLNVSEGSPAAAAGLVAANPATGRGGDLIIAVDGQPVGTFSDLNSYLVFHTEPGQTVTLTLLRDGETLELALTLASRPG